MMSANNCLRFLRSLTALCCLASASVSVSKAEVLFTENFTYPDGEFGAASGGVWGLHSGTGGQDIAGNKLFLDDNGTGDYSRPFGSTISSNQVFAGFDLTLPSSDTTTATSDEDHYFAHFAANVTGSPQIFVSRVIPFRVSAGVFKLAISRVSGTGESKTDFPVNFASDTTHRVVMSYDFSTQTSTLWLDPTSMSSTSVSNSTGLNPLPTGLAWFAFRNHSTGTSGDKIVDNLVVATTFNEAADLGTAQAGDFDGDGDVDGADFVVWQTNYPAENGHSLATGDADGDTDVDGADFAKWQDNFPHAPSSGVAPVPEPAAWMLMGLTLPALGLLRKRRTT